MMDKSQKKKSVSVNVSLLGLLTLEDGTDRLSWNVGKELSLNAAQYLRREEMIEQYRPLFGSPW